MIFFFFSCAERIVKPSVKQFNINILATVIIHKAAVDVKDDGFHRDLDMK